MAGSSVVVFSAACPGEGARTGMLLLEDEEATKIARLY
jgi:hypothetical protein